MNKIMMAACLAWLAPVAVAQCPYQTATSVAYGTGCSEAFGLPPTLSAQLDTAACELRITVHADGACCNTYMSATMLVLGFQQVTMPLPGFDPSCVLVVSPASVLVHPGLTNASVFSLPIPAGAPPLTLYAQGGATYYTTVTFPAPSPTMLALTQGMGISLQ